ncbi:hypothetical protein EYF80_054673 [Liparis tanakae]|uniref:Uncharacterized protein n=1 Tax=Liparis tanakae TaxID=230148 RepID=A0A4Z2F321_9TELE|nr:hypothetical protein EYF80_054673 [Liparis tanakae]
MVPLRGAHGASRCAQQRQHRVAPRRSAWPPQREHRRGEAREAPAEPRVDGAPEQPRSSAGGGPERRPEQRAPLRGTAPLARS